MHCTKYMTMEMRNVRALEANIKAMQCTKPNNGNER